MKEFNPTTIDLSGSNLIEASAGTGKTYSIALLALRLLLEKKDVKIEKILMVTFTEAAAAELKARAAKFIRFAIMELEVPNSSPEEPVKTIVNSAPGTKADKITLLQNALLDIDKATISTIHSFCKKTLSEFAFETSQIYGAAVKTDITKHIDRYTQQFAREKLAFTNIELLKWNFNKKPLADFTHYKKVVQQTFSGREFYFNPDDYLSIEQYKERCEKLKEPVIEDINNNLPYYRAKVNNNGALKYLQEAELLFDYLSKPEKQINFGFRDLFPIVIEQIKNMKVRQVELHKSVIHSILNDAIKFVVPKVKAALAERNELTFDDLIDKLHQARLNTALQSHLRANYSAVFIDEFQDTDKLQYEIFFEIFQNNSDTILFYIGDPKQSIYAFRKADLNTYFRAKSSVQKKWSMNINYRSTPAYVEAMNIFFDSDNSSSLNPFHNVGENPDRRIDYIKVNASKKTDCLLLNSSGKKIPALSIIHSHKYSYVPRQILQSLSVKIQEILASTLGDRRILPSNIGILVRTNNEAAAVKKLLSKYGIPAVVLDDTNIFTTTEAKNLIDICKAVLRPSKSTLSAALITKVIGNESSDLHRVDFDELVIIFKGFKKTWEEKGFYVLMQKLIEFFNIIEEPKKNYNDVQRTLSNLFQLIEILQDESQSKSLSPQDLINFLVTQSNDKEKIAAYEQRIESDSAAVKIVTVHKSKGLEYDIVFAPFLNAGPKEIGDFTSFRVPNDNADDSRYYFTTKPIENDCKDLFITQTIQEQRRLIYVALTRAKYCAFLFSDNTEQSSLDPFITAIINKPAENFIHIENFEEEKIPNPRYQYLPESTQQQSAKAFPEKKFADINYHKMSYSFLAAKHEYTAKEETRTYFPNSYDDFVFKQLQKGLHIGNLLHDIFEFSDYQNPDNWKEQIAQSITKFAPSKVDDENFAAHLLDMVTQVMECEIQINDASVTLKDIARTHRVNELEFNFPIPEEFDTSALRTCMQQDPEIEIHVKPSDNVKGMMNGLIDLFFEHEGKYYILDWKSNFLGDSLNHYEPEQLNAAMNESNYHLQYLLYSVAVNKYLSSKIPGFDFDTQFGGVIYLFLRGVRKNSNTGVFTKKVTSANVTAVEEALKLSYEMA
jgi:exodeoxyribonuclease V beta subunit